MPENTHIGKMIREVFDSLPKGCTAAWLAAVLHCGRANVYNIFSRANIDIELLTKISIALNHDFFHDLSEAYRHSSPDTDIPQKEQKTQ